MTPTATVIHQPGRYTNIGVGILDISTGEARLVRPFGPETRQMLKQSGGVRSYVARLRVSGAFAEDNSESPFYVLLFEVCTNRRFPLAGGGWQNHRGSQGDARPLERYGCHSSCRLTGAGGVSGVVPGWGEGCEPGECHCCHGQPGEKGRQAISLGHRVSAAHSLIESRARLR